jgi:predicted secreted hydrolase
MTGGSLRASAALGAALLAVLAALGPGAQGPARTRGADPSPADVVELAPGPGPAGFARALRARPFRFPEDHGPHYDYQTEWWYWTGNVRATNGSEYGFQLTFFRRGLRPGPPPEGPGLSTNQVYFAHFAITDAARGTHVAVERFARGKGALAGASGHPFSVWLEDWKAQSRGDGRVVRLRARDQSRGLLLDLELEAEKPLVAHGDHGLSPKGVDPGNASYYLSFTRLRARGRLAAREGSEPPTQASGTAWFDHEWSTSALGPRAVGWDWFSLQLGDGRDLMFFRIRREDGRVEPASAGTLVGREGATWRLGPEDVQVEVEAEWTSPRSGVRYPAAWRVRVPSQGLDLRIEPLVADQEVRASFTYWEGAVRVAPAGSTRDAAAAGGRGYVELTGYGSSLRDVF